jgi:hypothetical protein
LLTALHITRDLAPLPAQLASMTERLFHKEGNMAISQSPAQIPLNAADHPVATIALDTDFDARWAAWIARGRVHEQRVRRRFVVWASVVATGAAIAYAFLGS